MYKPKKSIRFIFIFWLLITLICVGPAAFAKTTPNVWAVLRQQFMLSHELNRPEVQTQIRWLMTHRDYLNQLARSEPYIYHIVTEIKRRHLPGEIALIPMIESSFDPFAYSGAGAAGLWQLMPETGSDLGLKRDWWFDGRRSIGPSTEAALNYLSYLNKFFNGNWILAFAGYNAGEGAIARSIKNSGQNANRPISFWSLNVPHETKAYVPRLMALAEIIQNPQRYHVELPDIPHVPYFEEVNIGTQIDLNHAAKLAGISYDALIQLNPGYNHWTTAPYRPYKLLIPANKVEHFSRNLANFPTEDRISWQRHKVSAGDNLNLIAQKYHTSIHLIKDLNQLKSNSVQKGQYVLIPQKPTPPAPPKNTAVQIKQYKVIHIVQKQDTFATLQKKYDVTEAQIKTWNHLKTATLRQGQTLTLWKSAHTADAPKSKAQTSQFYQVKTGDTLSQIAADHHMSLKQLIQQNPGLKVYALKPGQVLKLSN